MKYALQEDHIRVNKYRMAVIGLPVDLTPVNIGALDRETDTVDLPDRTKASGGREKANETEISIPAHHLQEVAAMNIWRMEAIDPVSPTYKKTAVVTAFSGTGIRVMMRTCEGAWLNKDGTPDLEMNDEGEMAVIKYGMCWDSILG